MIFRDFFQKNWNKKIWDSALKSQNQFSKSFEQIITLKQKKKFKRTKLLINKITFLQVMLYYNLYRLIQGLL